MSAASTPTLTWIKGGQTSFYIVEGLRERTEHLDIIIIIIIIIIQTFVRHTLSASELNLGCRIYITLYKEIYFFFPPITQWCSISDVLFTGGRGVSDFSVLKYY